MTLALPIHEATGQIKHLLNESMKAPVPWSHDRLGTARIKDRFFETQKPGLRLSFGNSCARRHWYEEHEPEVFEPADGLTRVKFSFGDTLEALMLSAFGGYLERAKGPWMLDPAFAQSELSRTIAGKKIFGHPDGLLLHEGEPYVIIDSKNTTVWTWNKWVQAGTPDSMWGYPQQAANYVTAYERPLAGFMWLAGVLDNNNIKALEVAYMTSEELATFADKAAKVYTTAITSKTPPPKINPGCNAVPCRAGGTIYCRACTFCSKDNR